LINAFGEAENCAMARIGMHIFQRLAREETGIFHVVQNMYFLRRNHLITKDKTSILTFKKT
jgi:hypothetical protein